MKKLKMFFIWQDNNEEAWLNDQSRQGFNLTKVKFPFSYYFIESSHDKYFYHLNAPKDANVNHETFLEPYRKSGWENIGHMNGWHYFRKLNSEEIKQELEWANENKAAKFQRSMMFLVGLLPFLLFIFPAIGKRITPPLFSVLRIAYFIFLGFYTIITYRVYRRVNQLRDL